MLSLFWGFRLTIWNVNDCLMFITRVYESCFRLTIWNVNLSASSEIAYSSRVLD
ncbi:hypothetical protein QSK_1599 [Clostridioides difficile P29]|nr:hypothetical protein QSK_1599 [Clostridioides difficile P29]